MQDDDLPVEGQSPLGAAIVRRRRAFGWSQMKLSRQSGVYQTTLSRIEKGLSLNPSVQTLQALAGALGTTVAEILAECAPPPEVTVEEQIRRLDGRIAMLEVALEEAAQLLERLAAANVDIEQTLREMSARRSGSVKRQRPAGE